MRGWRRAWQYHPLGAGLSFSLMMLLDRQMVGFEFNLVFGAQKF